MNYWIFKVNPEYYDIDKRLLDPASGMIWPITRYPDRIKKGDKVFVWKNSAPRGICAVMEIEANPYQPQSQDIDDGYVVSPGKDVDINSTQWAKCRIIQRFPTVEASVIKKIPGLELFSFFSAFPQAINFSITKPEGTILLEFIEERKAEEMTKKPETPSKPASKTAKPQSVKAATSKQKPVKAKSGASSNVTLLKCEECGRYVVSSDTERHIQEAHAGRPVEWQKTK